MNAFFFPLRLADEDYYQPKPKFHYPRMSGRVLPMPLRTYDLSHNKLTRNSTVIALYAVCFSYNIYCI